LFNNNIYASSIFISDNSCCNSDFRYFFLSKAECGKNYGFGAFEKYRCSCLGFIGRTPVLDKMNIELDSTIDYSCFGIKVGKTRLVSESGGMLAELCSMQYLCVYPKDITIEKGSDASSIITIQDTANSTTLYKLLVSKGDGYDANQTKMENTLDFSYDTHIIELNGKDKKTISLDISSDNKAKTGVYILKVVLMDANNATKGEDQLYVNVK